MLRNRLLEVRLKMGYKFQKDFAEFLGIARNQYTRYENNSVQPSLEVLYDISRKLNCHMEDLIEKVESIK